MEGRTGLPKGTVLDGSYRIERVIGSGGFGITYVAEDVKLRTKVAIKEYYPGEFGRRDESLSVRPTSENQKATFEWGRTSFLREAQTLARFRHPSVVQVTRVFEAYSTAYMVMIFEEGPSLEAWLKRLGRAPTQNELDRIAGPLLDALQVMHAQSFLHRDIAPDNIIVRADGTPVLLDFGAARVAVAEMTKAITGIVKPGYSPHEQYATDGRLQGPWTDLYAFGATLYRAVTGHSPEEATLRVTDDRLAPAADGAKSTYRPGFLIAIDACLKVRPSDRPQSVAHLRPMLLGQRPQPKALEHFIDVFEEQSTRQVTQRVGNYRPRKWGRWSVIAAVVGLSGVAYGVFEYTQSMGPGKTVAENKRQTELQAGMRRSEEERKAEQEAKRQEGAADRNRPQTSPLVGFSGTPDAIDRTLQGIPLWRVVKREFPDWYAERVKEAAALASQNKDESGIGLHMARALVALRRQHVNDALAADFTLLKAVASTFYENLVQLRKHSTEACFEFISRGEASPKIVSLFKDPAHSARLQAQMIVVFEAIADGRKSPRVYTQPRKSDYDVLAGDLTKRGWTQADMHIFSDEKRLSAASPDKTCQLVQDWFGGLIVKCDAVCAVSSRNSKLI